MFVATASCATADFVRGEAKGDMAKTLRVRSADNGLTPSASLGLWASLTPPRGEPTFRFSLPSMLMSSRKKGVVRARL